MQGKLCKKQKISGEAKFSSLKQKSKVDLQENKRSMDYQFIDKFLEIRPWRFTGVKSTLKLCKKLQNLGGT